MVQVAVVGEPWESNRVIENQKASEMLMNIFIHFLEVGYRKVELSLERYLTAMFSTTCYRVRTAVDVARGTADKNSIVMTKCVPGKPTLNHL